MMNYLDMLAKLGIGNAHPGGFAATLEWLDSCPIPTNSRILEVGCGTGRTACYLAKQGHQVTAMDIRADMLDKAKYRAEQEGVAIHFRIGNVEELPFESRTFDIVLAESVTIFARGKLALSEYYRVLTPNGMLYDREMLAVKPLSSNLSEIVHDYYGVERIWSAADWRAALHEVGFGQVELLQPGIFEDWDWTDEIRYPDLRMVTDPSIYFDERIWLLSRRYDEIMLSYGDHFGFGLWKGCKIE